MSLNLSGEIIPVGKKLSQAKRSYSTQTPVIIYHKLFAIPFNLRIIGPKKTISCLLLIPMPIFTKRKKAQYVENELWRRKCY